MPTRRKLDPGIEARAAGYGLTVVRP